MAWTERDSDNLSRIADAMTPASDLVVWLDSIDVDALKAEVMSGGWSDNVIEATVQVLQEAARDAQP